MFCKDAETKVAKRSVHKLVTLKKNYEFQFVFKKGKRYSSKSFGLIVAPIKKKYPKFGIVISKKIGKAVVRNKKRRQIKEILRTMDCIPNQYVIVAKDCIIDAEFFNLKNEIKEIFERYKFLNEPCTKNNNKNGESI